MTTTLSANVGGVEHPWELAADEVAAGLGTDAVRGLSTAEAATRLDTHGHNELEEQGGEPAWRLFLEQFANTMLVVLMAAAAVTAALGDLKDTVIIVAIVLLSGIVGFVQEYRAERAMAALKELTTPTARVVRDGEARIIPASHVVPGDLIQLEPGDVVAADLRLVESHTLRIEEAPLTGESEPAEKVGGPLDGVSAAVLAEQRNMAFKGTTVTYGRGSGIVVATAMRTALGRIAELLQEHPPGKTPLQQRLAVLGKRMAVAAMVVCAVVFAAGVAQGESVQLMFLTAVSLAVAAIPEALPAVVTVSLALGALRLAQRRALVRKLPAVETLGTVDVVCSDKTGTLTENRMLVERVWTPLGMYAVTGQGYAPEGVIEGTRDPASDGCLQRAALVSAACNDAALHAPRRPGEPWTVTGDPTEAALLSFAGKLGVHRRELDERLPRVAEIAFDASRRRMLTLHRDGAGTWAAVKGAPDAIESLGEGADRESWEAAREAANKLAADGFRVLALAERRLDAPLSDVENVERDLSLLALVGMADPPRPESAAAVAAAREAGITPVMITGDHVLTAQAIARRLGILDDSGQTLSGAALEQFDDAEFERAVAGVSVYARTNPEQKLRIVEAWKQRGSVVAMTGDGVNDAPALRRADIGIAMGVTGTEVSKEAADMVLADDNFATIIAAVGEGRRIYDNIRRFVRYLLTTNSGEVWVMFLAPFLGLPLPLLPIHILWVNLVTDGLPAIALGLEPAEPDAMRRPPRPRSESLFARGLWQHAIWVGILMAVLTLGVQAAAIGLGWEWQTMTFTTLALLQLGHALAVRSERQSFFRLGWRTNTPLLGAVVITAAVQLALVYVPALQPVFDTEALGPLELAVVLAVSTLVFAGVELEKWVIRRRG